MFKWFFFSLRVQGTCSETGGPHLIFQLQGILKFLYKLYTSIQLLNFCVKIYKANALKLQSYVLHVTW